MKTKYLSILLLITLSFQMGLSQESFINTNKTWKMIDHYSIAVYGSPICWYHIAVGDTIISDFQYTKIWKYWKEDKSDLFHVGFIREDTSGIVYGMDKQYNEGILYNFNVKEGDTIHIINQFYFSSDPLSATVISVSDSVILEKSRRIITLSGIQNGGTEIWIEGIGSTEGLLESGIGFMRGYTGQDFLLLCYYEEDILNFKNPNFSCSCGFNTDAASFTYSDAIKVYPNPVEDFIYIKLWDLTDLNYLRISIYDAKGSIVYTKAINSSEDLLTVPVKQLPPGIYYYSLNNPANICISGKFIKQ